MPAERSEGQAFWIGKLTLNREYCSYSSYWFLWIGLASTTTSTTTTTITYCCYGAGRFLREIGDGDDLRSRLSGLHEPLRRASLRLHPHRPLVGGESLDERVHYCSWYCKYVCICIWIDVCLYVLVSVSEFEFEFDGRVCVPELLYCSLPEEKARIC